MRLPQQREGRTDQGEHQRHCRETTEPPHRRAVRCRLPEQQPRAAHEHKRHDEAIVPHLQRIEVMRQPLVNVNLRRFGDRCLIDAAVHQQRRNDARRSDRQRHDWRDPGGPSLMRLAVGNDPHNSCRQRRPAADERVECHGQTHEEPHSIPTALRHIGKREENQREGKTLALHAAHDPFAGHVEVLQQENEERGAEHRSPRPW